MRIAELIIFLKHTLLLVERNAAPGVDHLHRHRGPPAPVTTAFVLGGGGLLGAAEVGIRYRGRTDVVMMEVAPGSSVAGVFTSNKCPGAPVDWCRGAVKGRKARLVVVNAGNANCATGEAGDTDSACSGSYHPVNLCGSDRKRSFKRTTGRQLDDKSGSYRWHRSYNNNKRTRYRNI